VTPLTESYVRGPALPAVRDITMGDALREAARDCPDRVALITGTPDVTQRRQWTYAQMLAESEQAARALLTRFEPGEHIAIWAPNVPQWVMLEFAAALAGMVLVTVNPSFQADELAYALKQSKSAGIFLLPEFRGNRMLHSLESVQENCEHLREVILLDQWPAFLALGDSPRELPRVNPQDVCMIQYTSGTTGFPKGAMLHHRGLVNNGAHVIDRMGVVEGSTYLTMMPLFHTGGCALCVLGAVSKRMTQVLVEAFDPGLALELTETYGACSFTGVPTMLIAMLEHPDFRTRDLSTITSINSGGSTVPAALVQRLEQELNAPFTIVFGQTECSPVASMTRPDDTLSDKAETLGGPMPAVEIKIIDPESGATLPIGELGEYCTRGYHVMDRYFDMEQATAKTIDRDGWLHTGDLCSMDERGYCKVEGRLKDMIIRGGENIYPREIEEMLFQHDSVGDAAVVGLPDDRLGEVVGAFLRPAPGQTLDRNTLHAYLREHLSPQKTPRFWFCIDDFPMTGSGKIQKFELRKRWLAGDYSEIPAQ
jgi:fatty-acyl-CoA synthase